MNLQKSNCLHLVHVDQPYLNFHTKIFKEYYDNVTAFNYLNYYYHNGLRALENEIDRIIEENNITDIILFQWYTNFVPTVEYLQKLRKKVFVISWLFDDDVFFNSYGKYYNQAVDTVVTADYFGKIMYEQLNIPSIFYLSTYSKDTYKPQKTIQNIDVSFVGRVTKGDRKEYIQYLIDNGINVEIYGKDSENGMISESEMIEVFNRSKINLNFTKIGYCMSLEEDNPLISRIRQNKGRPVEIGLTKSFCLSESAASLDKLFNKYSEIDTFDSKEELLEKVQFYLAKETLRDKYSNNLYDKCISTYEKDVYMQNIFKQIEHIRKLKDRNKIDYYHIHKSKLFKIKEKSWFIDRAKFWIFKRQDFKLFCEQIGYIFKNDISLVPLAIIYGYKEFGIGESK